MTIKVCLAGATGWAGSELARAIAGTQDITLAGAVSRKHAGRFLGEVLGEPRLACRVHGSAAEALADPCDVFVEYTKPENAKGNIVPQSARRTWWSGPPASPTAITPRSTPSPARSAGVLACGNFALTVVLLRSSPRPPRVHPPWKSSITRTTADRRPSGTARGSPRARRGAPARADHPGGQDGRPREARGAVSLAGPLHPTARVRDQC
jgi:4-hydroxy-tetrahydrodipicolinate reductase